LPIPDIIDIAESENRLPYIFSQKIYNAGETAMGGRFFTLVFADGTEQPYECGNLVDFLPLPTRKKMADIVELKLHTVTYGKNVMHQLDSEKYYFSLWK